VDRRGGLPGQPKLLEEATNAQELMGSSAAVSALMVVCRAPDRPPRQSAGKRRRTHDQPVGHAQVQISCLHGSVFGCFQVQRAVMCSSPDQQTQGRQLNDMLLTKETGKRNQPLGTDRWVSAEFSASARRALPSTMSAFKARAGRNTGNTQPVRRTEWHAYAIAAATQQTPTAVKLKCPGPQASSKKNGGTHQPSITAASSTSSGVRRIATTNGPRPCPLPGAPTVQSVLVHVAFGFQDRRLETGTSAFPSVECRTGSAHTNRTPSAPASACYSPRDACPATMAGFAAIGALDVRLALCQHHRLCPNSPQYLARDDCLLALP